MQQNNGDVLVVCGGWHAPALANMWRECPQEINKPELPSLADAVTGCYLTPYSEKRLDVLAGYLSGMPAPVWQNWCWQCGLQQAGEQLLKTVLTRLRQHKLPASTADMAAAHLHVMALAQLRGHTLPLRTDWLDAIAGSLIKEALNAPLPWSYRGVIHPDTDPILLTLIDTLAGDGFGKLALDATATSAKRCHLRTGTYRNLSSGGAYLKSLYPRWTGAKSGVTSAGNTGDPRGCAPAGKYTDTCRQR